MPNQTRKDPVSVLVEFRNESNGAICTIEVMPLLILNQEALKAAIAKHQETTISRITILRTIA